MQIHQLSAHDLAKAYADRRLSPVDVLGDALGRLDRFEPAINAFTLVDREGALAAARASEARWLAGGPLGPADGLIATVKSNVATQGWPLRRGSTTIPADPSTIDSPASARLREAGCVLLGQTTMPEFGWKGVTHCALTGVTRNPWNLDTTPGGSSGGAVAAAALGIGSLHVGTDGAGSIRIPCSFTGLPGIKPSVGRVPAFPASPFGQIAHVGPIARSVADVALLLTLLAQPDARDPGAAAAPMADVGPDLGRGVAGLRLAWSPRLGYVDGLNPEVEAATHRAALALGEAGATVEAVDPGFSFDAAFGPLSVLWNAGCAAILDAIASDARDRVDPGFRTCAAAGAGLSAVDVLKALAGRAALYEHMRRFHERFDALLTPTMPIPALEAGRDTPADGRFGADWINWSPYTYPFNLTGQPAASVPVGLTGGGLPIGLQIVGPPQRDGLVLRIAQAVEAAFPPLRIDEPRRSAAAA